MDNEVVKGSETEGKTVRTSTTNLGSVLIIVVSLATG